MPAMASSGVLNNRFSTEPKRALLTPSASPSLPPPDRPPPKRPRLRSTPSSSISATPRSASNESTSSAEVNSARRASTLRVLNVWAQLAERYNKRLDEDDIVDLYSGSIIKDRGVVKGAPRDYLIGHFAQPDGDQDYPDADQDQEDSEQDDDDNELNALPPSEATTDDDAPVSKKDLLRGVPPLSATTDAEDLREFLEAEKKRRELAGDEEDEGDLSSERLSAIRKALEEESRKEQAAFASQAQDVAGEEHPLEPQIDTTPTRPSTHVPLSDDESEDELALWTRDESTAIYPVARDESEQDVREVEQEVIELTDSDSDEEFEAILTHPPPFARVSPLPVPHPKEPQQLLQSPPDSERGRFRSRTHSQSKIKSKAKTTSKSESRPRSPLVPRKPEVILAHKRKPSVSKETATVASDAEGSDQEVVGHIPPTPKGKGKEISSPVDDNRREKIPKSLGVESRSRKRKRIASSTSSPLAQSPEEPKSSSRGRGKPTSRSSITLPQPDGPESNLGQDISTSAQFESTIPSPSLSLPFSVVSKTQQPTLSVPAYGSLEPESVQPTLFSHNCNRALPADSPIAVTHPYPQRHSSHPPSIFSSPNQGTPGPSLAGHLPPPMDPVQTQQAHYLLAQAMQQLSYLISSMPPYTAYASNPSQPWHHPPPPLHAAYGTPIHQPSDFHGAHHYHTPSSTISPSRLPPSSPVRFSVSPTVEERRARSRGRSKPRGRRVSFKLDSEEIISSREHNIQPELHHSGQKNRKQIIEIKRERGKEKATEEFDNAFRLEDRDSPPPERGRTPGPPSRKNIDVSRGKSLSRR